MKKRVDRKHLREGGEPDPYEWMNPRDRSFVNTPPNKETQKFLKKQRKKQTIAEWICMLFGMPP